MTELKKEAVEASSEIQEGSTAAVGCSKKWTKLIGHVKRFSTRFVVAIADHAARFPKYYLVGVPVLTVALVVIGVFTNFTFEGDEDVLFTPVGSKPIDHNKWITDESGFAQSPRTGTLLIHSDGANILGQEGVARVFAALDAVLGVDSYEQVCASQGEGDSPCDISSVTQFWNNSVASFNENVNSDEDAIAAMSATTFPDGTPVFLAGIIGNAAVDTATGLLTFGATYVQNIETPDTDTAKDWEKDVIDVLRDLQEDWDKESGNSFMLEF